jgi:hypothetical protein
MDNVDGIGVTRVVSFNRIGFEEKFRVTLDFCGWWIRAGVNSQPLFRLVLYYLPQFREERYGVQRLSSSERLETCIECLTGIVS